MKDIDVLIVDDIDDVRKLLKTLLRGLGIKQIHEATNGREAFRILERQVNLVLMVLFSSLIPRKYL